MEKNIENYTEIPLINDRIKAIRKYLKLSQIDFAEKLGIGQSTCSSLEKGDCIPTLDVIKKINGLGFSFEWIVYGHDKSEIDRKVTIENIEKLLPHLSLKQLIFINDFIKTYIKIG